MSSDRLEDRNVANFLKWKFCVALAKRKPRKSGETASCAACLTPQPLAPPARSGPMALRAVMTTAQQQLIGQSPVLRKHKERVFAGKTRNT